MATKTQTKPTGKVRYYADRSLAPFATRWETTRGRDMKEPEPTDRTPFQRDRDRIVHSDAFRRLQYKTQVFTNSEEGDFRTRLTHSLEVAQLTRTICRTLGLDEDLGEAVALAHDLGHPPFGHAGEEALDRCMESFGGFRHNDNTMKILRKLERRYAAFDGLNLTWETLEGAAKHNGPIEGDVPAVMADLEPETWCGLEAQVAALCDDIAYNHHDLDDGLMSGKLYLDDVIGALPNFRRVWEEVTSTYPQQEEHRLIKETIRRMMTRQVKDLLHTSTHKLNKVQPQSAEEVRAYDTALILFSKDMAADMKNMKQFLFKRMYRHYQVNRMMFRAYRVIDGLFNVYMNHRKMLPMHVQKLLPADVNDDKAKAHVVCDYIACMTDRSAMSEHNLLFGAADNRFASR